MDEIGNLEALETQAEALTLTLGASADMAASFDAELRRVRASMGEAGKDVATLERGLSRGLRRAFDGVMFDGMKLSDALRTMARSMVGTAYSAAARPVARHFGGLIAGGVGAMVQEVLPFAHGAPFSQGRVMPFANGGIVSGPVRFPMRGGTGLMGEAGPEAIMPLSRGPDGRLGVRSEGGRAVSVVMHVQTPDVQGFQRSQSQIAAQMGRALSRGQRNR
ncbi:MAG: phage tail tape measure protein [Pseudooceanicola nanhaiensis]|jgi:phage-related minor tail protein|uniref:phage tail tape measure protein n=1 Tax=Pseudooceanicola nanhaiensis TaxID=375761 RepID=UPI004059103C